MNKKLVLTLITIFCFSSVFFIGCSSDDSQTDTETTQEEVVEEKEVLFEDNEFVNDFFVNYQEISNTEFSDYSSSRKYTCSAANSGYWFVVSHFSNTNELNVRIEETNDTADAGVPAMRDVYFYTVKALDNTLSDEDIYTIFDNREELKGEQTLNSLTISITPDLELSSGHSRGHIDITKNIE